MSKALRTSLVVIGVLVAGAALILVGMTISRFNWASPWGWHGFGSPEFNSETSEAIPSPPRGMMSFPSLEGEEYSPYGYMDPSMMGSNGMGYGMMGRSSMMGDADMMNGYGMMNGMGMMGSFPNSSLLGIEPIPLADAEAAIQDYLDALQADNLAIGEIMIFDNHAYAQIVEIDTGIGALEVLVDPVTYAVSPEPGPNMMWNLKYSPMSGVGGHGMMGMMGMMGVMGTFSNESSESMDGMMGESSAQDVSAELLLPPGEAVEVAQRYLDVYVPGSEADDHADPFYGYYTIHVLRNGETVGMLSVNGYTRQVFLHSWHGELVSTSDH